jgi:peptidyl-tRNA hydrolase
MTPVLYILMRTDLPSMNAGKAMAQASHASNAFVKMAEGDPHPERASLTKAWAEETKQGFGTVLVLGCNGEQMKRIVADARTNILIAGLVLDPTYPYRVSGEIANIIDPENVYDNTKEVTLVRAEHTCGFVFGDKDGLAGSVVAELRLHP